MRNTSSKTCGGLGLLLACGAIACAPVRLTAGDYQETCGPGVIVFEGRALHLASDHTFAYEHWSDDINSGRYGTGAYELTGNKLRLHFATPPPIAVQVRARPLAAPPDSLVLAFTVAAQAAQTKALPGAAIIAYDEQNHVVASAASDAAGRAVLRLSRPARRLLVSSLGFVPWQQGCPASSTAYELNLPVNRGTPYAAGTVKELRLVRGRQSANALAVKEGQRETLFQREEPNH